MNCHQCSASLPPGSAFCPECGAKVEAAEVRPDPTMETTTDFFPGGTRYVGSGSADGDVRLEPGTEFDGRYTIEEVVGSGGMGVVYRAMDSIAQRPIALKVINSRLLSGPGAVERLIDEGLLTRDIRHPNVVAVYDVARSGEQPYVTMEYLDGKSLRGWLGHQLTTDGEVSFEAAAGIVKSILDGLQAAHETGVVHRDLKPENVILRGDPNEDDYRLKILDFGIARAMNVSLMETSAAALGTPLYMAPEQRTTPEAAGPAADIYSLSRIFYELLMDVLPDGTWQPPSKHRSDVPEGVDALLEKGLSNRPKSRQQSVEEYRAELLAAVSAPKPEPEEKKKPERKKNPLNLDDRIEEKLKTDGKWDKKKIGMAVGAGILGVLALSVLEDGGGGGSSSSGGSSSGASSSGTSTGGGSTSGANWTSSGGGTTSGVKPPPPPPPNDLSGTWYTNDGSTVYEVSHDGNRIYGVASTAMGDFVMEGTLTGQNFRGTVEGVAMPLSARLTGRMANATHMTLTASWNNGLTTPDTFHINHVPGTE